MPYIRHVFYKVTIRQARRGGSFKQQTAAVLKKWDCALTRFRELANKQQQEKNPKPREVIQTYYKKSKFRGKHELRKHDLGKLPKATINAANFKDLFAQCMMALKFP